MATIPICHHTAFIQKFQVYGGSAYDGDIISAYLTDAVNFRIYIRTYDDPHEAIRIDCKDPDTIVVFYLTQEAATEKYLIQDSMAYSFLH